MTIDPLHPTGLREVLETTATVHVLIFDDGEVHRDVTAALARRRHPALHSCHVTDYFDAESALWRARSGDLVLLVGSAESLEEGLGAARDRGFGDDEIVLVPFEDGRGPVLCARCAGRGTADATEAPSSVACVGCDLGMPGVA